MAISSLDTLDIAKRLKEAGFSEAQTEAVTTVFRDVRTADLAPLATKADIERLESEIQHLEVTTRTPRSSASNRNWTTNSSYCVAT